MTTTIKIHVKLFAFLTGYLPKTIDKDAWFVETTEGIVLKDFLSELNIPMEKVKLIFLNGIHATGDEILKDRDRVGLFPPIAGG